MEYSELQMNDKNIMVLIGLKEREKEQLENALNSS